MRRLVIIGFACATLAACGDTWLGENAPPPLPGKRISVLAHAKSLEPDVGGTLPITLPQPEQVADWPEVGGYPPHAMHHLAVGNDLKKAWSSSIGSGGNKRRALLTEPVVSGGTVYAMDAESVVSAYQLKDGHRLWDIDLSPDDVGDGSYGGGLAYDEGKLFVTTGFNELVTLNPADGHVLWRQTLPAPVRGAPTARAGRVIVITVDNETLALSAEDGHQLWHHNGLTEVASLLGGSSPAIDGNTVLVPYTSGELFALRIENGSVQWSDVISSIKRTDQVAELTDIHGLPVIDRGRVYAAGNSDIFAAIDLRTGRRYWDREVGSMQTPWVAGDFVYLLDNAPELVCFEAGGGRVRWVTPLDEWENPGDKKGRIAWTGPVLASDRLIVASSLGIALSISPYTGKILSKLELPDSVSIPPVIADDTLLFVTDDGDLVAYR
jgi:outer membrane protein assembly factor BamB